jgi:nucleoside-diphosphate-sugar epimerase
MDLQYVEDVAETFVRCLLSPAEGAFVFNLRGSVVNLQELIRLIEQLRPEAAGSITAAGPQVPVSYRMDDSPLQAYVPGLPCTPLERGVHKTLEIFEKLGSRSVL